MTNAEVITRLKAYMNIVNGVEKERREFGKYCSRDKVAFAIVINRLERAEKAEKRYKIAFKTLIFLLVTLLAVVLTILAAKVAATERGYYAIGSEVFIFPLVYFLFYGLESSLKGIKKTFKEVWKGDDGDEAK